MTMIPFNTQIEPFEIDYEDEGTHNGGWDEWTVKDEGHVETPNGFISPLTALKLRDWLNKVLTESDARAESGTP